MDTFHNAEEGVEGPYSGMVLTAPISLARFGPIVVSAHTDIGGRTAQEDRLVMAPNLVSNGNHVAFFGIFDGTAGDFASDIIQKIIVRHLVTTDVWRSLMLHLDNNVDDGTTIPGLAMLSLSQMYANADAELLDLCHKFQNNYSSCTSGDSRVSMCYEEEGTLFAKFITTDHKPDVPHEESRILAAGGSVQYIPTHENKPFLRGGDFLARKAKGDMPMQIQYSRAFGGKDLKLYGLHNDPDITVFRREESHKGFILASDGLWDTIECQQAFCNAFYALNRGDNPSRYLVHTTLAEDKRLAKRSDNITIIVIFFEE
ncbi:putative serine threonine phosphatase 2C containing protein [Babesia divergens]|uniref:Serine threonine phosphatase 2C containing protein n=1 Tax=Babesia divergens TaxID=32595 RepID=A0AAD9GHW7_BABDI|nr:putative serine threonine phosphatase 2C containing protein [Babesia divergens]